MLSAQSEQRRTETEAAQARAADPSASAWVAANAGTGKTHVLVMRVLRLLLAGTAPDRILCLTYTKAAAAEMSVRLFSRLARWATASAEALVTDLRNVTGVQPDRDTQARARTLFARAIETPGGLKVQTIHAFCERVLKRFPLEAGVASGFTVLDDATEQELRRTSVDAVLGRAAAEPDSPMGRALTVMVAHALGETFDEVLKAALAEREWLAELVRDDTGDDPHAALLAALCRTLGVRAGSSDASLEAELNALIDEHRARDLYNLCREGGKSDLAQSETLAPASLGDASRAERVEAICAFLLTKDNQPKQRIMTKDLAAQRPDLAEWCARAQSQAEALVRERSALAVAEASAALVRVADAVAQELDAAKARRSALSFDDMIAKTARLLSHSADAQWVLYKLDGGLDHVLVDEAQDTSPKQWQVVEGLTSEFFHGFGQNDAVRTVFAVGDEKQSIYSFQDAAPEEFARMGRAVAERAGAAGLPFHRVPLTLSFRSTEAVLGAVDAVFAEPATRTGLTSDGAMVEHLADRLGHGGLVELWPLELPADTPAVDPFAPVTAEEASVATGTTPARLVAERVAARIARMLADGERLASEDRPIRAGDVLVLLRGRQPLGPEIIRALEQRGVPVAGADRIRVTEEIGVEDLVALGRVLLLPEDDLALAGVLKSPLFNVSEHDLFGLAYDRKGSLWSTLLKQADAQPALFGRAAADLKRWRSEADFLPPFEFYSAVLDRDGGRERLLAGLGSEAAEALDEFLNLALRHDASEPPTLQGFLGWLANAGAEVKRDMDQGRDEVRVMTVHASKGLEAPIVFLPDTTAKIEKKRPVLVAVPALANRGAPPNPAVASPPLLVWTIKGAGKLDAVEQAAAGIRQAAEEEYRRLLYVALTRPRDRLYVAGAADARGNSARDCWYARIAEGLKDRLTRHVEADGSPNGYPVLRLETPQTAPPVVRPQRAAGTAAAAPFPDWARRAAAKEVEPTVPLAPSRLVPLESDEGTGIAPPREAGPRPAIADPDRRRFLRGTLTHALLQHLPDVPVPGRAAAASRYLAEAGADLGAATHAAILAEVTAILTAPDFAGLFTPASRAEVPVAALLPLANGTTLQVSGQVDRLAVTDRDVMIVDYKANRAPPRDLTGVPRTYLLQLAAYRLVLARIYPRRSVRAALLWTAAPLLMELPAAMLDSAAAEILAGRPWSDRN